MSKTFPRHTPSVHDVIKNFPGLPDSANVRLPVVQMLFGCCAATVYTMVKRGSLPAPRKLSERVSTWNVGELRKYLNERGIHE